MNSIGDGASFRLVLSQRNRRKDATQSTHKVCRNSTARDSAWEQPRGLGSRYVQYVNYTYKRSGTLWEGRYKSSLIDSERYLLTCYRYIELNPVRAGMVKGAGDYKWSSYATHALGQTNELIQDHSCYLALGATEESRRTAYQALFRHQVDEETLTGIR